MPAPCARRVLREWSCHAQNAGMPISTCTLPHKHWPVAMPAGALPDAFLLTRLMPTSGMDYSSTSIAVTERPATSSAATPIGSLKRRGPELPGLT